VPGSMAAETKLNRRHIAKKTREKAVIVLSKDEYEVVVGMLDEYASLFHLVHGDLYRQPERSYPLYRSLVC